MFKPVMAASFAALAVSLATCTEPSPDDDSSDTLGMGACGAPRCEIELIYVARISDGDEPGILPLRVIWLQRDGSGRLLTTSMDGSTLVVFNPDGSLLTLIGRRGQGPGEFLRARTVIPGPGDTIFVPDPVQRRVTVVGPDLEVHRTFRAPYVPDLVLENGSLIVASHIGTREASGYPIHMVDQDGVVVRSFGTDQPQFRPDLALTLDRRVALSADGSIWAAGRGSYVLERWDPSTGERVQRVEVQSSWFVESERYNYDELVRPDPIIEGIWEDDRGLVWVIIRDADLGWEPPARANEERAYTEEEYNRLYDWVIEVIDPDSGTIVASKRFRDVHWYRPPSKILVSPADTDITTVAFDVWEPTLQPGR